MPEIFYTERESSGIETVDIALNKNSMVHNSNTTVEHILSGTESFPVTTVLIRAHYLIHLLYRIKLLNSSRRVHCTCEGDLAV